MLDVEQIVQRRIGPVEHALDMVEVVVRRPRGVLAKTGEAEPGVVDTAAFLLDVVAEIRPGRRKLLVRVRVAATGVDVSAAVDRGRDHAAHPSVEAVLACAGRRRQVVGGRDHRRALTLELRLVQRRNRYGLGPRRAGTEKEQGGKYPPGDETELHKSVAEPRTPPVPDHWPPRTART